jgi:hypothetical protein
VGADLDPDAGPLALLDDVRLSDHEAGYVAALGPQSAQARAAVPGAHAGRGRTAERHGGPVGISCARTTGRPSPPARALGGAEEKAKQAGASWSAREEDF